MPLNAPGAGFVRKFWMLFVILLMLLAVYVSVGRMVMPRLNNYQPQLEAMLSEALGLQVSAYQLQGGWEGFNPTATFEQLTLKQPLDNALLDAQKSVLEIEQLKVRLDVVSSLLSRQVVFSSLTLQGMSLELKELEKGRWRVPGLPKKSNDSSKSPFDWLLNQNEILLADIRLTLHPLNTGKKVLNIPNWGLRCGLVVCSSQGKVSWQIDDNHELNFSLNIFGKPGDEDFQLEGYLATAPIQITDWLPLVNFENELIDDIQSLLVGGEVWFDWKDGHLEDIRGSLDIPQIELGSQHEAMSAIDYLHTDFSWLRETGIENELQALWLSNLTFKYAGEVFESAQRRISLLQRGDEKVARLIADHITLDPIVNTLLALESLPEKIRSPLNDLRPSGELYNLQLEYQLPDEEKEQKQWFKIEGQLKNVSILPWRHVPEIRGVSGYLEVLPEKGQLDFASKDLLLHFPRVFSESWQFDKAHGVISWIREGRTLWLSGRNLRMSGDVGEVIGSFRSLSSKDGLEPRLSLLIGLENSHLPDALTLVPDVVASPKLVSWLNQAFEKGDISSARFVLEQKVKKGSKPITRSLGLDVEADEVDFSFHPGWPHLTGADVNVQIRDQQVAVQADSARWFELGLDDIDVFYEGKSGASRLTGTANVNGPLNDAWRTLTESPLRKHLFTLGEDFQFSGDMKDGQLRLDIPFASPGKSDVNLSFKTQDAALKIPSISLYARSIKGGFTYSTLEGLVAPEVTASMFGHSTAVSISSGKTLDGVATKLTAKGRLTTPMLSPWVPATTLALLEGETAYQAELSVGKDSENHFLVRSDLNGVTINLPTPLGKKAEQKASFVFKTSLSDKQIHELRYADKFGYALSFVEGEYQEGQITLGDGLAEFVEGSGIDARGKLDELNFKEWQKIVEGVEKSSGANASQKPQQVARAPEDWALLSRINKVQLDVGQFTFLEKNYDNVIFNAVQHQGDWLIGFDNQEARGELGYYRDSQKALSVNFDYLYMPAREGAVNEPTVSEFASNENEDALVDVIPQELPELDINIKTLFLENKPFGRWAFKLRPQADGAIFEELDFELRGIQAKGDLHWLQEGGAHRTEFSGNARIPDIAAMLKAWDKPAAIEGKKAVVSGQLSWSGTPANFSLLNTQGPVSLKAKKGRIVDMTSIRLLGVLNFNSLSRRLRLDFSDLFKKGFSFDRAEGKLQFDNGQMLMAESLIIDGPSAKFKIDGRTDLINEQFDQDVIVVLPVKDNIPVIATLAGFPQVGVPIYLFNRAFGDVLDRFTSANYRVTGSWDDPDIKLTSFFDSQSLPKSSQPGKKQGRGKKK